MEGSWGEAQWRRDEVSAEGKIRCPTKIPDSEQLAERPGSSDGGERSFFSDDLPPAAAESRPTTSLSYATRRRVRARSLILDCASEKVLAVTTKRARITESLKRKYGETPEVSSRGERDYV